MCDLLSICLNLVFGLIYVAESENMLRHFCIWTVVIFHKNKLFHLYARIHNAVSVAIWKNRSNVKNCVLYRGENAVQLT